MDVQEVGAQLDEQPRPVGNLRPQRLDAEVRRFEEEAVAAPRAMGMDLRPQPLRAMRPSRPFELARAFAFTFESFAHPLPQADVDREMQRIGRSQEYPSWCRVVWRG
jgi:hypothetical protein